MVNSCQHIKLDNLIFGGKFTYLRKVYDANSGRKKKVMRFDKIVIVGSGKIACDIIQILIKRIDLTKITVIESKNSSLSFLESICKNKGIRFFSPIDMNIIEEYLIFEAKEKLSVLVISANNRHIFSKKILTCSNFEVINFHYSYLPNYRGMNIPTWVIYNRESYTGVTWHYVTDIIDGGKIISRKKFFLTDDITAFDVTYQGMKLGIEAFKEFIFDFLEKKIEGIEIREDELGAIYFNNELPGNGYINLNDSCDNIYKLLRCYDYGKINVLQPLNIVYCNRKYYVKNYKKLTDKYTSNKRDNEIVIKGNMFDLKITIEEVI